MRATRGSTKYGPSGLYNTQSFNNLDLPHDVRSTLAATANQAICQNSWSSYRTAAKMLDRCLTEHNETLTLPLPERLVTLFIGWLLKKNLSVSTIKTYLSGVRILHLTKGITPPNLRPPVIQHILTGRENSENRDKKSGKTKVRLPMTPDLMRLLKKELIKADLDNHGKACLWSVSTLAFAGGFRISELLCKTASSFDPDYALLKRDLKLKPTQSGKSSLQITLKCDKTNKSHLSVMVDVFASGSEICPIRAYQKYRSFNAPDADDQPAFKMSSGTALTAKKLNSFIKHRLAPHLGDVRGTLSSHSFRIGITSLLGQSGLPTEELKHIGRWSSSAYEFYLKLPRTNRLRLAEKISSLI